jgi:hypothetical protein
MSEYVRHITERAVERKKFIQTLSVFSDMKHHESYTETKATNFHPSLVYSLRAKNASVTCMKLFTLLKRLVSNPGPLKKCL